jgi:hypothetical protein
MKRLDSANLESIQGGGWWDDWAVGAACGLAILETVATGGLAAPVAVVACIAALAT